MIMIGYKRFNSNFTCLGFQYQPGHTYAHEGEVSISFSGFHFCVNPHHVTEYYSNDGSNRFAIITAWGDIDQGDNINAARYIRIERECTFDEMVAHFNERTKHGLWILNTLYHEHYLNGQLHYDNGPAVIYTDGNYEQWWQHGKLHRENGPAIKYTNVWIEWWYQGERHRVDGPAVEWPNGYKEWWLHGKLHRENGPAVVCPEEGNEWYVNGILHRENGPAIERINGTKIWAVHGKPYHITGPPDEN